MVLSSCSSQWENEALPNELKDASLLVSSDQDGFREGCWSAVYRLSDKAARGIAAKGLDFFSKTWGEPDYRWRETPGEIDYAGNGRGAKVTFYGLYAVGGCANRSDPRFRSREIGKALQQSGSYYLSGGNREKIIVVVPRSRLVGYYYFG